MTWAQLNTALPLRKLLAHRTADFWVSILVLHGHHHPRSSREEQYPSDTMHFSLEQLSAFSKETMATKAIIAHMLVTRDEKLAAPPSQLLPWVYFIITWTHRTIYLHTYCDLQFLILFHPLIPLPLNPLDLMVSHLLFLFRNISSHSLPVEADST